MDTELSSRVFTTMSPRRLGILIVAGLAFLACWWQIRTLGDVRLHLSMFYGWFAALFLLYLVILWLVHQWEWPPASSAFSISAASFIVLVAVAARGFLLPTTPTLSDDIYRYRWDGRVQRAGIDPYAYPPSAPELAFLRDESWASINFPNLRTIYPPLTQQAFRLAHWGQPLISLAEGHEARIRWLSPIFTQKIVFVGAEIVLIASLLWLLVRRRRSLLWIAAYAWHPLPILEIAGSGHNDALGVAMLWLGILAWELRRYGMAALGWTLAFLSKYATVVLAPWWWARRIGRRWLVVAAALAAGALAWSPTVISALFESLSAMASRFESNSSIYVLVALLLGHSGLARGVVFAAWGVLLIWWAQRQADPVRYVLGVFTAAALLSPVLHPWYLVWVIPAFCFVRVPAIMALTGTVVLVYTVWLGRLADGRWEVPIWVRIVEYAPVALLGVWEVRRWWLGSSFRLATRPRPSVTS